MHTTHRNVGGDFGSPGRTITAAGSVPTAVVMGPSSRTYLGCDDFRAIGIHSALFPRPLTGRMPAHEVENIGSQPVLMPRRRRGVPTDCAHYLQTRARAGTRACIPGSVGVLRSPAFDL